MIAAIVIDIEGTASPTSSVRENLYGYTRHHLGQWLANNLGGAADPVIAEPANWQRNPTPARARWRKSFAAGWIPMSRLSR